MDLKLSALGDGLSSVTRTGSSGDLPGRDSYTECRGPRSNYVVVPVVDDRKNFCDPVAQPCLRVPQDPTPRLLRGCGPKEEQSCHGFPFVRLFTPHPSHLCPHTRADVTGTEGRISVRIPSFPDPHLYDVFYDFYLVPKFRPFHYCLVYGTLIKFHCQSHCR